MQKQPSSHSCTELSKTVFLYWHCLGDILNKAEHKTEVGYSLFRVFTSSDW